MNKLFFAIGISCFFIPLGLQMMDKGAQESLITTYEQTIESFDDEEIMICLKEAKDYNQTLFTLQNVAAGESLAADIISSYESQLNLTKTGMIGQIQIPKIDVQLPIYHGTSDEVLQSGIGHLKESSLPVGGENTHAILTGHCGLPSAELFTRLDEMEEGDSFCVRVCNTNLVYEVEEIQVVEPDDAEIIKITEGKDQVSLITCTPYGINTHRLIVTGSRVSEEEKMEELLRKEESERGGNEKIRYFIIFGSVLSVCIVCRSFRREHRDRNTGTR